ncbi:hypothetical protein SLEP1_g48218 [Rubroshorea leprosula]|uniref:Uncharacterized protein n=1 Tax=Rubroshorea leprosula TaxID=152421 RepID=A0AAV5LSY4_9ROSI|nr:hypothetical protein SLEP1_g48218 [Rubroshorea leprosula]
MAMVLDSKTDLSFPYWASVHRRFGPDSSFFATGNLERELLAKQVALDLTEDEKHQLQEMVRVYPREVQPENPNSLGARKREYFRMCRERDLLLYPWSDIPEFFAKNKGSKAKQEGIVSQPELVLASAADATDESPIC